MQVATQAPWRPALAAFLRHLDASPLWRSAGGEVAVVAHGSATVGNADRYSDVDVQLISPGPTHQELLRRAVAAGLLVPGQRPVVYRSTEPTLDGRRALCAAEIRPLDDLANALRHDPLVELWVMQNAWAIRDPGGRVAAHVAAATQRFHHDLEALCATELGHAARRQRWLAIAAQRGDPASIAMLAADFVRSALRLACLLANQPTPTNKWLHHWASEHTPTGAEIGPACVDLLWRPGHIDVEQASATVLDAAQFAAHRRWPDAAWPHAPHRYGAVRS